MSLSLKKLVYFILFCQISLYVCDDELDGQVVLYLHHALESLEDIPIFTSRGIITIYPSLNEATYSQDKALTSIENEKLKKLAESDGIYRIKLFPIINQSNNNSLLSYTRACALYESGLTDIITVTIDQSGLPVGVAISAFPPTCTKSQMADTKVTYFNTSVNLVTLVNGPAPDTLTYIQRLEQEKAEKAKGEQGDNRSFFAKYWMYIVPFVIFLFISGASGTEGQAPGR